MEKLEDKPIDKLEDELEYNLEYELEDTLDESLGEELKDIPQYVPTTKEAYILPCNAMIVYPGTGTVLCS